jgi:hypothetical protein
MLVTSTARFVKHFPFARLDSSDVIIVTVAADHSAMILHTQGAEK